MEKACFTETEIAYVIHIFSKYTMNKELLAVCRLLTNRFTNLEVPEKTSFLQKVGKWFRSKCE